MTSQAGGDHSDDIIARVREARACGQSLYIKAGDSKRELLGRRCNAPCLDVSRHRGIVDYHSGELALTARAATPLVEIARVLQEQGQELPFDPPLFDGAATLGGTLACNLSGPARPWSGSVRDAVLGLQLVNGKGEKLNFGGKVMKNVAGYDVSRLQAGALGTLGVLTEISLKVLPRQEHSLTLAYDMSAAQAVQAMNRRAGETRPLSGACWVGGRMYLRLSGAESAVEHSADLWGGERLADADRFWQGLRDMTLPFFRGDGPVWRLSMKATAGVDTSTDNTLVDWCGAQRWLLGEQDASALRAMALANGGHAALFRGGDRDGEVRQQPDPVAQRLQQRLKQAFDPDGVLNPGRLYSWL